MPRLRIPLLILAMALLGAAIGVEVYRRWPRPPKEPGHARGLTGDGEVTFLRLARTVAGRPLYRGGAYLAGGVLVDCGPPVTAAAVCDWLQGRAVEAVVVTHHHEDHSGGAALLKAPSGPHPAHPRGGPRAAGAAAFRWRSTAASRLGPSLDRRGGPAAGGGGGGRRPAGGGRDAGPQPGPRLLLRARAGLAVHRRPVPGRAPALSPDGRGLSSRSSRRCDACARCRSRACLCAHRGPVRGRSGGPAPPARPPASLREHVLDLLAQGLPGGGGRAAGRGAGRAADLADAAATSPRATSCARWPETPADARPLAARQSGGQRPPLPSGPC